MKKLHEIVADLEAELVQCSPEDYPRVCVELCGYLGYVDGVRAGKLVDALLAKPTIIDQPIYHAHALAMAAAARLNQMQPQEASSLAIEAMTIAQQCESLEALVSAKRQHTGILLYSGQPDLAISLARECEAMALEMANTDELFHAKTLLYNVYMEQDQALAGKYIFEAEQLAAKLEKGWLLGYAKLLMGLWSHALKRYDEAEQHLLHARMIFETEGATEYLLATCDRLGDVFNQLKKHELALALHLKTFELAGQLNNTRYLINGSYSLGISYKYLNQFNHAESWILQSIERAKEASYKIEEASALLLLATLYSENGQIDKAIEYNLLGREVYGNNMRPRNKASYARRMQLLYKEKGDFEKAYQYLAEYIEIRLKLQDEQRIKETTRLQQLYEKEKREAELRELHIKKQQAELEQAESELKAIRAQMNPHFIFNALNTIQSYIYLNDKQNASNYLGKFSRLTRMVLDMSNNETVSLKDELEALTLYLELERMRFEEVLSFTIDLVGELDIESIKLPAMLIQPYIENAIKHGLLHKKDNRELWCGFQLEGNKLVVTIDDNGIGRHRSGELNAIKGDRHQSFATQANAKRFNLLNKDRDETVGALYTDKVDEHGQPSGTKVVLTIPVQFDGVQC